jgi:hypothetical protein
MIAKTSAVECAGEQIAVTHFRQYNHAETLSIRFPF